MKKLGLFLLFLLAAAAAALAQNECAAVNPNYFPVQTTRDTNDQVHQTLCQDPVTGKVYATAWFISQAVGTGFNLVTSGSNLNPLTMGNGGSFSPLNFGQIVGNQLWLQPGIATLTQASFSAVNSGGSIGSGHVNFIQYTLNSVLGETVPNVQLGVNLSAAGCTIGSCTLTVAAPTIPSGYTGWTMYWCDQSGGGGCTVPVKVLACANIITSCSVTNAALNSGVLPPTVNTAVITPANLQGTECPPGVVASMFSPDAAGNYHTWGGMLFDSNQTVPRTTGTPVICHSTFFTDQKTNPVVGNNAFVVIDHQSGVNTDFTNNQDRALWVGMTNLATDVSARYSITGIQAETDVRGAPTWTASVDGETVTGSFQLEDDLTNSPGVPPGGSQVIRAQFFSRPQGNNGLTNVAGVRSIMSAFRPSGAYAAGTKFSALDASWGGSAPLANLQGIGLSLDFPVTAQKYGALNVGIEVSAPGGGMTVASTDWLIDSLLAGLQTNLNGPVGVASLVAENASGAFNFQAPVNMTSSLTVGQGVIPAPSGIGSCTGGASTYSYALVGVDANGGQTISANANSGGTCSNPLTSGNPAVVNISNTTTTDPQYASFVRIDVYRTAGPMGLGKIGTLTCNSTNRTMGISCNGFSDTGIAATGTAPVGNTTGGAQVAGYLGTATNTVRVASNFTTAASTALQTITGLTWNLDTNAKNYSFHCALSYSQATAAAAVAFGIQAATNAPTNIFANGIAQITVGPPATEVNGTLATLTTTTATAIVTGTPGAIATNYVAALDGSIEEPANPNGNAINIMVSTAVAGDAVTVLRGSYCYLY